MGERDNLKNRVLNEGGMQMHSSHPKRHLEGEKVLGSRGFTDVSHVAEDAFIAGQYGDRESMPKLGFVEFPYLVEGKREVVTKRLLRNDQKSVETFERPVIASEILSNGGDEAVYVLAEISKTDAGVRGGRGVFAIATCEGLHRELSAAVQDHPGLVREIYQEAFPDLASVDGLYVV